MIIGKALSMPASVGDTTHHQSHIVGTTILTLSKIKPGPTDSQKVVRHFMAGARVLISATLSPIPVSKAYLMI